MKKILPALQLLLYALTATAQNYPNPEFINEVSAFQKDSSKLLRLEKESSKLESKSKFGGVGGSESGYTIGDEKSTIRFSSYSNTKFSFVYWNGAGASKTSMSAAADSTMRANGMDPAMFTNMGMDPSNMISLYKMESGSGKRKIILGGSPGMISFGKKNKESPRYSCSFKKIRDGYYEIIVDKALPKGEYAFVIMGAGAMMGGSSLFAFGID